jgi:hydroxyethylthiazole kinase-like uncharacterized protein yjeF
MQTFDPQLLKKLHIQSSDSHKGAGGKLTIIGGSKLFHGASLWSLKVASRIVDMVFYSSIEENNELTKSLKADLYDFIAVSRENLDEYIEQSDVVLIGPGLTREEGREKDEEPTRQLTERLLEKFSSKKWVLDAGALTEMEPVWLKELQNVLITPHHQEFKTLFGEEGNEDSVLRKAAEFNCTILLKGPIDIVSDGKEIIKVEGGNAGMTKGGTGDVLAGLVAALYCKNDALLAAAASSYINKRAGESLAQRVGTNFNASDLCDEIPGVMKELH